MNAQTTNPVPKRGDHVGMDGQSGQFEVVDVNTLMQMANLKTMDGEGHVMRNVSWTLLKFPRKDSR